ncbi:uncharacterized protein [Branchiostoma lanceolatum]|uniref:uncharacterized protein n=1 Tax=Branchiostoma lanceolatum TaxID=7740 RepID=UPI0034521262
MTYEERLRVLDLPTLVYRRIRGDLINTYKFIHGVYDLESPFDLIEETRTRGHSLRIKRKTSKSNRRAHFFSVRVIPWWNSLPETVVVSPSINCFKERLDRLMRKHKVYFDFRALDNPHKLEMTVT